MASEGQQPPSFAIVGYAARFPGAADADEFWDVLRDGRDAISEVPADRWDVDEFFDPDPDTPGKVATRRAGFVDDVTGFDAPFFGMSTREVRMLDPQHRLLLETAWRAVEHSGTAPTSLANSNTGVFVGLATHDYLGMASGELTFPEIEAYMAIGTSNAAAAGRISFRLGLQGPAVAVDTACSSSLVAIHQACQALQLGECDLALAGGANVLLTPATMITFSSAHMLSPDGRCKTFDAAADGYVRGEGCGVIVIKRLEDAINAGDNIRAVIRGSAINQDGASGGLTVPNGVAQQRVIGEALKRAGLMPADVDYLEAHGTGTSLGDPIEAQAAGAVLGEGRADGDPLLIGSAKTNIGHLEAAAGIAGVIKVILSLENEMLPAHLHFENPSPHIPWDRLALEVVKEARPWQRNGKPRIAGISSFGFAGTNAHVILEEAPATPAQVVDAPTDQGADKRFNILPISARTPDALVQIADQYRSWLNAHPEATLADMCLTTGVGRAHFEHRAALVVNSMESASELLGALADDRPAPGLVRGISDTPPKTAWLFTGQGSQYPGMARELYDTEPVFAETLDRCAAAVADVLDKPLQDVIFEVDSVDAEETLRQTTYAQPALFAVEMGLARLWQSWGFEPAVVLGHSVGQYSAACVAGVFSLEDGAKLMAERGRLFGSLPAGGRMVAVFAAAERVERLTDQFPSLSVAAYNGANTVLSGPAGDLEKAVSTLTADGVRCDWLETSHAFHSALLDPILDEFEKFADGFSYASPQRILVDNRTGAVIGRSQKLDGNYWRRHARQPVEFAKSVQTLSDLSCKVLLEIGPQPILTAAALRAWPDPATTPKAIASLRKNTADHRQIIEALADAYALGHLPDFGAVQHGSARKLDLPTYPFQHRQYWFRENREMPTQQSHVASTSETVRLLEDGKIEELAALLGSSGDDGQTRSVLTKLAAQHNRQRKTKSISDARYEFRWDKLTAEAPGPTESVTWLLIGDDGDVVAPLVEALTEGGQKHRIIGSPASDADEQQLVAALRAAAEESAALRIVDFSAVDSDTVPSQHSLARVQHQVLGGTRRLFRAAAAAELRVPIWVITRGAQRVSDADTVSPEQTAVWGFGRAASLELPHLWGGLADVSEGTADEWSQVVNQAAAEQRREDQFAVRGQAVYVPRLVRRTGQPSSAQLALREDATYLVTGGLGSIGLEIAGYLAAAGAKHLVLTSRRTPNELAQKRIDALSEEHGSEILVITADVAEAEDVSRLLSTVKADLPPLAGIVHAAGEIDTTPLAELTDAEVDRVFAGKVWGAWHLSEAAADLSLDFFVTTSSIASVWGGYGQSAYGAANAFLDGLTWRLREKGIAGVSANFGPWSAGMADADSRAKLAKRGIKTLSPADALAGLADLIAVAGDQGAASGVVARIDWAKFLPLYQNAGRRAFLAELEREVPAAAAPVTTASGKTELVERLTNAPVQQRRKLMSDFLRDAVADVTRVDPSEIREDAGFFDLGMDSLMAVELRRRIEQNVGKEIPATLAMDHPRLSDTVDYLLSDVLALTEQKAGPAVATAVARSDEPIAIIAVSCRFPGAPNPEAFWELLSGGVNAIREVPEDRFDIDEFYDADPDAAGKTYTRFGGFLDGIDGFDPEFFGISPREAVWIEPQQRLMLETVWEGLERAGYSPASLRGSRTGIFAGVAANEYAHLLSAESIEKIEPYFITGNALNAISGRVAFALGFEGPAVAVDTACSSSLVAVHQAVQALHSGDCDLALAGGVNVLLSPVTVVAASRARMLSPVGQCKTFDASADGYVRSEGCGILVLKRLSDAQRDGDRIAAVIPGSAVNQDGASSGLTVPNGGAQQRLIATALARAGLSGGDVDYLEAHGTGTPLGDPIEVQAAGAVYGASRETNRPLLMGSVKTNIGHTESASGAAGLIKVVLSLQNGVLPQSLHFDNPSPHIPWGSLPVKVVDKSTPWEPNGRPRRAGVSSFGFTGTNAHVLIEEAPAPQPVTVDEEPVAEVVATPDSTSETVHVLPLSARSPEALVELAQRYGAWLDSHLEADIAEVCRTAGVGRSHFEHRAALVVDSAQTAIDGLTDLAAGQLRPGVVRGECTDRPTTAWLFTGQGSQYPGMARELFDAEPVFAETVKRCADAVSELLPESLLDVIFQTDRETGGKAGERLKHTSNAQPALFAIEMGLARLWQSWGLEPDVVLGHSVGQYAAACVAGVFSIEDGARLMAERGRLFGSLPAGGRMVAVFADPKQVEQVAADYPRVSVGAYNGPNTVLSGPGDDLERVVATFTEDGVRCTWLETSHAFHSELLEPVLDEFETFATQFEFATPTLPLVCNRTGAILTAETPLDAQYWRKHSRQPVQFAESVRTVAALGCSVLMEIGPQPVLTGAAVQIWPEHLAAPRAIVSLRKGVSDRRQIADALANAYVSGHRPTFETLYRQHGRRLELPTYPFQRRRFWPKSSAITVDGPAMSGLLGSGKDLASGDSVYTSRLSVKSQPWLNDHVIYGTVVVPGATYAAMALAAVGTPAHVKEVFFYEPIILPEKASREVQLTLSPLEEGWKFQVHSRPYGVKDADWSLNADGTAIAGVGPEPEAAEDGAPEEAIDTAIERMERMRPQELFETFDDMELSWGPNWSGSLKSLWLGEGEAIGDISVGAELAENLGTEPMHPVLMDLCTGVAFPAFPALRAAEQGVSGLFLPLRYEQVTLKDKMPRRFYCRAKWHTSDLDSETQVFDLDYLDRDGRNLGGIRGFTVKRAPREALLRGLGGDTTRLLYTLGWHEVPLAPSEEAATPSGTWLVAGFGELAAALPGCIPFDRTDDSELLGQVLAQAHDKGMPYTGIVWRGCGPKSAESTPEQITRLEAEIENLLSAVHTAQADNSIKLPGGLWIVTERAVATESGEPVDAVQSALWGLGRTILNEEPGLRSKLIDVDGSPEAVKLLTGLLATPVDEPELALRQGKALASRLLQWSRSGHLNVPRADDYALLPTERGAIDNLRLTEKQVEPPEPGYVQVRVEAAGLNFRDVLNVLGLYPGDPGPVGGDFAGTVTQLGEGVSHVEVGQRVYGSMQGAFASRFNVPGQFLAPIPDGVSAVEAATIPAAALTVRLSFDWSGLNPGDKVLIHAASGGVGLAAIQMAQQHGAEVYATASTFKRATLRKLGVKHVYDSRTTDFADQILADTGGSGVDVVLNSLTSEGFIEATVRATAKNGRFAEIAKRDIWTPEQMAEVRPDIAYEIVALDTVMFTEPDRIRDLLTEVSDGLAKGEWKPLPAEIYPLTEARTAFRRMQQARHIGKIVCQMPNPLAPRPDRTYLITGGLGAIGLHTASFLAQRGAGDIVLTSRREPDAEAQRTIEDIAERYKTRIHTFSADVGVESDVEKLLERIRTELPPLAGVAHLAGVLDDALLNQQELDRFRTTLAPKAFGAIYLDRLTREDKLDFFIVSSSVSSLLGPPGQANYSTANALLDGLIAERKAHGLPGTAINFGPWGGSGMASSEAASSNISAQGLLPLDASGALGAMAEVVANGTGQATVLKANWARAAKVMGSSRPPILDLVLPSEMAEVVDSELLKQLQELPVSERATFITEFLQREVQGFLRLAQPPAPTSRFLDLGTDSLMAVELRNRLHSQFGGKFTINATAVFDYPTIGGLGEYLAAQMPDAEGEAPAVEAAAPEADGEEPSTNGSSNGSHSPVAESEPEPAEQS
ncbi:type I polyketide synthase [Mycobacterium paraterrae]|uniref:SDR family NAD(P)-dependent oxidoreductase n=1 Tax=Mycobacterium paraterrae TaxID=577492 RepID=A0ABY3VPB8_9MYCO|nr:type I polyketide synthase [Mycobacterium paraterrae]UMB71291.1 SDR family NAD(P)-dependent oxidoreductase [Mycobacterium paraterrae]